MSSEHYRTPPEWCLLIEQLSPNGVALDPWAGRRTQINFVKARRYLYLDERRRNGGGGFAVDWRPIVRDGLAYNNPPYSREKLALCMAKIIREATVEQVWNLALVPASTDTRWFQQAALSADQLVMLRRRIRFVDPALIQRRRRRGQRVDRDRPRGKGDNTARFSNVIFHWAGDVDREQRIARFAELFAPHGLIVPCDPIRALYAPPAPTPRRTPLVLLQGGRTL